MLTAKQIVQHYRIVGNIDRRRLFCLVNDTVQLQGVFYDGGGSCHDTPTAVM
jgi:hypothetical protein